MCTSVTRRNLTYTKSCKFVHVWWPKDWYQIKNYDNMVDTSLADNETKNVIMHSIQWNNYTMPPKRCKLTETRWIISNDRLILINVWLEVQRPILYVDTTQAYAYLKHLHSVSKMRTFSIWCRLNLFMVHDWFIIVKLPVYKQMYMR